MATKTVIEAVGGVYHGETTYSDVTVWSGLAAPAGTPPEIIDKLYEAASKAILHPEVKARLASLSVEASPLQPDKFVEFSRREIAKWARQVKEAGIEPE